MTSSFLRLAACLSAFAFALPASSAALCPREVTASDLAGMHVEAQEHSAILPQYSDDVRESMTAPLPGARAEAQVHGSRFQIVDASGEVSVLSRLNSGDDYGGWLALNVLRDGWLYAKGAQYDALLHVEKQGGRWVLSENFRIRQKAGRLVDAVGRWLVGMDAYQMKRDHLTRIVPKGDSRFYSPALHSMFFLDDGEVLKGGEFEPIGAGSGRWRYYGDLVPFGIALLGDPDGRLLAYDGEALRPVKGPRLSGSRLSTPLPGFRAFIGSGSKVFEIRGGDAGSLRLAELAPADGRPVGWFLNLVLGSGELIFVGRHAVYQLDGDVLRPVWRPDGPGFIDGPAAANRVADGQAIVTVRKDDRSEETRTVLLSACGGKP